MKILHFHYGTDGGAERFFINLASAFHQRGVEQRFFLRPGRSWRGEVEGLGLVYESHVRHISISRFFLAATIRKAVSEFQPQVLMAWRPRVCRLMKPYPHLLRVGRLGDYPRRLDPFCHADRMIVNTPGVAERFRSLGWEKPVDVISNFTRVVPCKPINRAELKTPKDAFVVIAVGRFVKIKGYDMLIDAVSRLPDVWLWLVGDGEERPALEKQVSDLGIAERLRFCGWRPNPGPFLAAADTVAMSSNHETLGNVILEAWSVGKPVVSTRAKGPLWIMTDGQDGLMADVGDAAGFASAIARLRDSPELRDHLVEGGRKTLTRNFTMDAVTDAYLRLFEEHAPRQILS